MWENAPHHWPSGKYKSKPQWDPTSHQWEWGKLTRQETTNVGEDVEQGEPSCTVGGNVNWCSHSGHCVEVPQTVKNIPALRPSNCTVGDLPQRYRCNEMPGHLHPDVSSSNVHNSQTVEGALVSIQRWLDKEAVVMYTMEYYSAIRNDKYPPFASRWMELEGIMLSEISQSEKDKHYMVSFIWGI